MNDLISVVIPVYKVEQYLDRCISSVVNQTYSNLEIILVDDGSPDNCPQICDEWSKKDKRIRTIHKRNGGLSEARNSGIDDALGKYLLLVDSDDYLELDACERLVHLIKKTKADFVVGVIREISGKRITYQRRTGIKNGEVLSNKDFIIKSIDANELYAPAVLNLYDLEFLNNNALRFQSGIFHEDMEMLPRLFLKANKISYLDYAFYNYDIRENSITTSSKNNNRKKRDMIQIYNNWKKEFDLVPDAILQKKLYGFLIKCYLRSCAMLDIKNWLVDGMNFAFALHFALNTKEKAKVVLFEAIPNIYLRVGKL